MRLLAGTPPILSTACIEPGLDQFLEAGIATPREAEKRGSHVSLRRPDAWRLTQSLIADHAVILDFRAPDLIRFGLAPLYNTFEVVFEAVTRLRLTLESKAYERYSPTRSAVT